MMGLCPFDLGDKWLAGLHENNFVFVPPIIIVSFSAGTRQATAFDRHVIMQIIFSW
jgi:hypothetical protein